MKSMSLAAISQLSIFTIAVFGLGCAELGPGPSSKGAPNTGLEQSASGYQEDTLNKCLNRIPKNATPGQHMLAKKSCERDKQNRLSIEAAPGPYLGY